MFKLYIFINVLRVENNYQ